MRPDESNHVHVHALPTPTPEDRSPATTPPKVPSWVTDVAKWGSLTRYERRQMERFHRKQQRTR